MIRICKLLGNSRKFHFLKIERSFMAFSSQIKTSIIGLYKRKHGTDKPTCCWGENRTILMFFSGSFLWNQLTHKFCRPTFCKNTLALGITCIISNANARLGGLWVTGWTWNLIFTNLHATCWNRFANSFRSKVIPFPVCITAILHSHVGRRLAMSAVAYTSQAWSKMWGYPLK